MDLIQLLQGLQQQIADAQAAAEKLAKENYDKGFADGVLSVGNGDKIYSQVEADALIAAAVTPLSEKVAALQVQVDGIPGLISDAVFKAKSDVLAAVLELVKSEGDDLESKLGSLSV